MVVNKVIYGGDTLVDLTEDTVTPQTLLRGVTAHAANGEQITGSFLPVAGVTSYNGRSGSVLPMAGDYTDDQVYLSSTMHIGGETQDTVAKALDALANNSGGGSGQTVMVNDLINNQTYPLTKITLSTSDPGSSYVFEQGEIWITYGNVT